MGLISKTVMIKWNSANKKYYEEKGYIFTKWKEEFEARVEDLSHGSNTLVDIKCDCEDCKNPYLKPIAWHCYKKYIHEDGKYYCINCAKKLYGGENSRITKLKNSKSFEKWCLNNNKQDILDRWNYGLNDCCPNDVLFSTDRKYWFKCDKHIEHKSELKEIRSIVRGTEKVIACKQCNSFGQWCIDNNRQDMLSMWDYNLNKLIPIEVAYSTNKQYYFICPKGLHKSELKNISIFTRDTITIMNCNQCNSFEQWCYDNLDIDYANEILSRWDYEKNIDNNGITFTPLDISYGSKGIDGKGYWFKCLEHPEHGSELKNTKSFVSSGYNGYMDCKCCNSFAQWGIDNIGIDFLEKYWDYEGNTLNPWKIDYSINKKVWIICQEKDYHKSYDISCNHFISGARCSYCQGIKTHPLDSLGQYIIDNYDEEFLNKVWSDKNIKSPFEHKPFSTNKVWWKCLDGKHEDYYRKISTANICSFRCPECQFSKGEKKIEEWLKENNYVKVSIDDYNNTYICLNNYYIPQMEFDKLLGLKGGNLSYDFYLPNYNLLIEYQGEYHDGTVSNQTQEEFEYQQEHDKRKKEYADNNNIKLLPIWYWDFDNIETILDKEIKEVDTFKLTS